MRGFHSKQTNIFKLNMRNSNVQIYRTLILVFTLLLSFIPTSWGKNTEFSFSTITIDDGLSNNTVFDIIQDIKGNIWVATADGLNKYDGYRLTTYRHDLEEANSLLSSNIRTLNLFKNKILIGTNIGLSVYDTQFNTFSNYNLGEQVNAIVANSDSTFILLTWSKIIEFDGHEMKVLFEDSHAAFQSAAMSKGDLLVGTRGGLFRFNLVSRSMVSVDEIFEKKFIQSILVTSDNIWVASEGFGLYEIEKSGKINLYEYNPGKPNSLSSNHIRSIRVDSQNRLWIGTFNGLDILDLNTRKIARYSSSDVSVNSLSQNSVRAIFNDNQGGVWLGTFYGGLNYYHPLQNQFSRIKHIPYSNSLSDNVVSSIVEDESGIMWIGTNEAGLNKYNPKTKHFTYYRKGKSENQLLSNNIKAIWTTPEYCYIGSHGGGLARLDKKSDKIKRFHRFNSDIISDNVYSIQEDSQRGVLWLATLNGLTSFDPKKEEFIPLSKYQPWGDVTDIQSLTSGQIYVLFIDSKHRLWIGADSGAYSYSFDKNLITHYDIDTRQQNSRINTFYEDHLGHIWIGSAAGLRLLNEDNQTFKTYTTREGLPNNNVLGILEDSFNRLWISTNHGLACFSLANEKIRVYTYLDGIASDQFTPYAHCKTAKGDLYFGGIEGITYFTPEEIKDNPFSPQPVINSLKVFSKEVLPNDETGILTQDISFTKELTLGPSQNSFTLSFSVPNFLSAQHSVFLYKLEGFDSGWIEMKDPHPISYSNLPPGRYTLYLKAGNGEEKWNNNPTQLIINIQPVWWKTVYFKLFVFLFLGGLTYLLWRFLHNRQELRNQLKIERLEKKQKEQINQMKLGFFINISHEFRTPLTLIISPLEELLQRTTDKWSINQIKVMQRNANKLLYLVNQLLDYRQAELGVFALKVKKHNPSEQIKSIMDMYNRLAEQKQINFNYFNAIPDEAVVLYDTSYLELILSNLLSNAFKFTPNQGKITIRTMVDADKFTLQVIDTGSGVSEEAIKHIFERFYQSNNKSKGTGIGLSVVKRLIDLHHGTIEVKSEPNQGTEFTISIPQDESLYRDEEFLKDQEVEKKYTLTSEVVDHIDVDATEEDLDTKEDELEKDRPTILIVEDDTDVRNYLVQNLKDTANVLSSDNGLDPIDIVRENEIDLVISDVMLPGQDGFKLCKSLKQSIKTSHIPVILLTAKTTAEDQMEGLMAGADDYIVKPFRISLLKMKIENRLKQKMRMLEYYSDNMEIEPSEVTFNEMDREFLEKAKEIVEQNLDNVEFQVDDFCEAMAMSRSNLHLKMKAITGESTIEFIRKIRFNAACKMLQDGRYSVAEVSAMVGFNTPSYFTTSFKKYFGILPTDYMKRSSK